MNVRASLWVWAAIAILALIASVTTHAAVVPVGDATYVEVGRIGDSYRGSIELRNQGAARVLVRLRQADYSFGADGTSTFGAAGVLPRSNAGWLHLDRDQVFIEPNATTRVSYEVRVPDDARLSGTYWSVVLAEEANAAEASGHASSGPRLRQSLRYALQVITEIGDSGRSEVAFHNARLVKNGTARFLDVDVENTGDRWLRTNAWIELHDLDGRMITRLPGNRGRTFPGSSIRGRFDLTPAPAGKYLALLVVDGGRNDLFGTQIELDLR